MKKIRFFTYLLLTTFVLCFFSESGESETSDSKSSSEVTFTLWQLPEQTASQMMSYVLRTAGGKVIVIDGGVHGEGFAGGSESGATA